MTRTAVVLVAATTLVIMGCPNNPRPGGTSSSSGAASTSDANGFDAGAQIPDAAVVDAAGADAAAVDLDAGPTVDAGCGANQIRDGVGRCRTLCQSTMDCATGERCDDTFGLCVPAPIAPTCNPTLCEPGYICPNPDAGPVDAGTHGCVRDPAYCSADNECSLVERCENHRCISRAGDIIQTCSPDAGCPLLMECRLGVCTGCLADIQCALATPGSRCLMGTCVTTGALGPAGECIGKTCPAGERCNVANGQCEPTCEQDSDCADAGKICAPVLNQCVTDYSCTADGGCAAGLSCAGAEQGLESGICIGCNDTTPCKPGQTCIATACFPDVAATACTGVACAQDESCDPQNGDCYPSNGRCTSDADCRTGHHCNFLGLCAGCSVDADCRPAQRCFAGTCLPSN